MKTARSCASWCNAICRFKPVRPPNTLAEYASLPWTHLHAGSFSGCPSADEHLVHLLDARCQTTLRPFSQPDLSTGRSERSQRLQHDCRYGSCYERPQRAKRTVFATATQRACKARRERQCEVINFLCKGCQIPDGRSNADGKDNCHRPRSRF